jgi:hypothetical protein
LVVGAPFETNVSASGAIESEFDTVAHAENSDVSFVAWLVAVAVIAWPMAGALLVMEIEAWPAPSVVTSWKPR